MGTIGFSLCCGRVKRFGEYISAGEGKDNIVALYQCNKVCREPGRSDVIRDLHARADARKKQRLTLIDMEVSKRKKGSHPKIETVPLNIEVKWLFW